MKSLKIFVSLLFLSSIAFAQSEKPIKWVIDKETFFTSLRIIESSENDTVLFLDNVSFHSEMFSIDSVDKIVYCKKSKKIIIGGSKHTPTLKISKALRPTILTPITEPSDSYYFDELIYVIGEKTYYIK